MLDHVCINAFKLAVHAPGKHWTKGQHKDFRELLWFELFGFTIQAKEGLQTDRLGQQRFDDKINHWYKKIATRGTCAWCSHQASLRSARSRTSSPLKRYFKDNIDTNIPAGRTPRVHWRYHGCGVHLCGKQRDCW